jgi:LysM repeat protein
MASREPHHLAWVWQFRHDGDPAFIRDTLASHGLGVALKTHDGADWMSRYDPSGNAVTGAPRVEAFANFFENGGVPFHAWAVVTGTNPEREAQLASEVLDAGARSLFLDLEPHKGFWVGTPDAAHRFGEALRRLQPSARLSTSVDARPWTIDRIPIGEFAEFSDEISPQAYWQTFSSPDNMTRYLAGGDVVGPAGITPGFVIGAATRRLASYGLPIHPIGDGTAAALNGWREFVDSSFRAHADSISVWRFGVADPGIWPLLRELAPRVLSYVVQPGDTLAAIAEHWGTSVEAIVAANEIANPNMVIVGTRLRMPYGAAPHVEASSGEEAYIVEGGDTLWSIAQRFGTSVEALMQVNGLSDASLLLVGQRLVLP